MTKRNVCLNIYLLHVHTPYMYMYIDVHVHVHVYLCINNISNIDANFHLQNR